MESLPVVTIYTDGSCKHGYGGWASVLICGTYQCNLCGSALHTTSNRMELTAAIEALKRLNTRCIVHLYSDSEYVVLGIHRYNKWLRSGKSIPNNDLWEELMNLIAIHKVIPNWVKGHNGTAFNEVCDSLAGYARENRIM